MMRREMPERFWKNLPEAQSHRAHAARSADAHAGDDRSDADRAGRAAGRGMDGGRACRNPHPRSTPFARRRNSASDARLWEPATQTVFGEGGAHAKLVFVGEQPGDQEDLAGHPFVGPAGKVLDRALAEAGIDRRQTYVTNAVKHFKFEPRGKRRHPQEAVVRRNPRLLDWLEGELSLIKPELVVMLGASAAQAVLRRPVVIGRERGRPIDMEEGRTGFVTVHPSYILRVQGDADREKAYAEFVRDLRKVAELSGLPVS